MISTYPDLARALWRCVGEYRGEDGSAATFRRVAEGFVWEFRGPPPRNSSEIALIGDGSFVLLEQNPQVHWHKALDCHMEAERFEVIYQSEWFPEWRAGLVLRGEELEYRREFGSGKAARFVLRRVVSG